MSRSKVRTPRRLRRLIPRTWIIVTVTVVALLFTMVTLFVYAQLSRNISEQVEQSLLWEARYYRQQLELVLRRHALALGAVMSSPAVSMADSMQVQREISHVVNSSNSVLRGWVGYVGRGSDQLVTAYNTRLDHVLTKTWWNDLVERGIFEELPYQIDGDYAFVNPPFRDEHGLSTIVELVNLQVRNMRIFSAGSIEINLVSALLDGPAADVDWSSVEVSIFSSEGQLIATPYHYFQREPLQLPDRPHPLMEQQRLHPDADSGFLFFDDQDMRRAGVFLRVPSVGMILTVQREANVAMEPLRHLITVSIIVVALGVILSSLLIGGILLGARKLRRAEDLAVVAEYRALQAHVNPHFLFNVLDRMGSRAMANDAQRVVEMTHSLADLFRYSIRNPDSLVTLSEELDYVERYVFLQKQRFGGRFEYSKEVQGLAKDCLMPKFSLQPLIENSFTHAVGKTMDVVQIQLRAYYTEGMVIITVGDNGPGMSDDRYQAVRNMITSGMDTAHSSSGDSGLANVQKRLQLLYGETYGLTIERRNPGVRITMSIPFEEQ